MSSLLQTNVTVAVRRSLNKAQSLRTNRENKHLYYFKYWFISCEFNKSLHELFLYVEHWNYYTIYFKSRIISRTHYTFHTEQLRETGNRQMWTETEKQVRVLQRCSVNKIVKNMYFLFILILPLKMHSVWTETVMLQAVKPNQWAERCWKALWGAGICRVGDSSRHYT